MQIASIVPKTRTQKEDIFDYAIPPEFLPQIRPGILVEIPFHGRKIEGIIIKLKSKSSFFAKASKDKQIYLKSIISIIDPTPVVDDIHIKLAQWMSDYYLAPLGKTLFENIVPPAIRILKKENLTPFIPRKNTTFTTGDVKVGKKYLIVGNFKERLKFYQEACRKTLKQNKSIIILVPDISLIRFFIDKFKMSHSIIHSRMTKSERWHQWEQIRRNKVKLIIGSQSALFAPAKNLGLIIIDQEENETYKNDRSPRFHAVKTAEELAKISAANLICGSLTPRVESYYRALKNIYTLRKTQTDKSPKITIVNMTGKHQAISQSLQEKIEENLAANKKIILVLNRKGEGTKFSCPDCGWIDLCQKCGLPLSSLGEKLFCFRCEKSYLPPEKCPKCQNAHLKAFGLGTAKLEKFVKDFWPEVRIIRLEKFSKSPLEKPWDIAIATAYGLKFNFPAVGLVGIIDADQGLNFPDYQAAEKNFRNFFKFLKIGEQGIIQTNLGENPLIQTLAQLDYEKFFLNELAEREKYGFPPFARLIRLLYKNQDEQKCQAEAKKIYQILRSDINNQSLLGPSPAFIRKRRNFYRWQIMIKIKKGRSLKEIAAILKTLPKGWIVDVDPVDLL